MECPHCGFMNLLDSGECVRCRKPLPQAPGAPAEVPADGLDLSEVRIESAPDEASTPPVFPEHGEEVDVSSATVEPVSGAGLKPAAAEPAATEAAPEPEAGEDTETADVPFVPGTNASASASGTGLKPAPKPPIGEASATYEGSDPELQELSRFFHQVKEQRGKDREEQASEEPPQPPAPPPAEHKEKPARRTRATTPPALFPTGEEALEQSQESDAFVPEFKETALPGMEQSSPSLSAAEPAPTVWARRAVPLLARIEAGLADLAIHLVILVLLCLGAFRVAGSSLQTILLSGRMLPVALPLLLVMALIFLGYQTFFAATAGQTPGQMLLGLRVEDETGDSPPLGQALLRSLVLFVCLLPLGLPLLLILATPDRHTLADKISRTRVTRIGRAI
jgi:uncharacterized RDD family membrane protein YckC